MDVIGIGAILQKRCRKWVLFLNAGVGTKMIILTFFDGGDWYLDHFSSRHEKRGFLQKKGFEIDEIVR